MNYHGDFDSKKIETSFVLGVVSCVLILLGLWFMGIFGSIPGAVCGYIGRRKLKLVGTPDSFDEQKYRVAEICNLIGLIVNCILTAVFLLAIVCGIMFLVGGVSLLAGFAAMF